MKQASDTRTFEYQDDKSSKFWEITQIDSTVMVRFGKSGTQGRTPEKSFAHATGGAKHVARFIAEKSGSGCAELGVHQPVRAAAQSASQRPELKPAHAAKTSRPVKVAIPLGPREDLQTPGPLRRARRLIDEDDECYGSDDV